MKGLVLMLIDNWNRVWLTLKEGENSMDIGWYVILVSRNV